MYVLAHSLAGYAEGLSSILCAGTQLLLNVQDLVVFSQTLVVAGITGLDWAGGQTHHKVCDEDVLRLAIPVRHHGAPSILLGELMMFDALPA